MYQPRTLAIFEAGGVPAHRLLSENYDDRYLYEARTLRAMHESRQQLDEIFSSIAKLGSKVTGAYRGYKAGGLAGIGAGWQRGGEEAEAAQKRARQLGAQGASQKWVGKAQTQQAKLGSMQQAAGQIQQKVGQRAQRFYAKSIPGQVRAGVRSATRGMVTDPAPTQKKKDDLGVPMAGSLGRPPTPGPEAQAKMRATIHQSPSWDPETKTTGPSVRDQRRETQRASERERIGGEAAALGQRQAAARGELGPGQSGEHTPAGGPPPRQQPTPPPGGGGGQPATETPTRQTPVGRPPAGAAPAPAAPSAAPPKIILPGDPKFRKPAAALQRSVDVPLHALVQEWSFRQRALGL
jgi:hypothetical protein